MDEEYDKVFGDFGWSSMEVEGIRRMSYCEVGEMLESVAWRKVSEMLSKDMEEKPKLRLLKEIVDLRVESSCATVRKKRERMMLVKLRGGTAPFQIEIGRWKGIARDGRICKECESGEVEDVSHASAFEVSCLGSYQGAAYCGPTTGCDASRIVSSGTNS